jgi:hypothetical protein
MALRNLGQAFRCSMVTSARARTANPRQTQYLLPKLASGEVDVEEAEIHVGLDEDGANL